MQILKYILLPFSALYWFFTWCRNLCFDWHILHQTTFSIPIISVGNITVGGTGKTPHVQYLINLLHDKKLATLSRGYKRQSKGFVLANNNTTVLELGDEPFLFKQRFPNIDVAVCEKRVCGVNELLHRIPQLETIILDDAFQHRYIHPSFQIVLIDYNRPIWDDHTFPAGRLREGMYALKRADCIIISKCPNNISEEYKKIVINKLQKYHKPIYFSSMEYGEIYNFATKQTFSNTTFLPEKNICLVTGIANPQPLVEYVQEKNQNIIHLKYKDHHAYSQDDAQKLNDIAKTHIILTTEKDVYKLAEILPQESLFVVPIMPKILFGEQEKFEKSIQSATNI